jgi:hypothetical protein
VRAAASRVRVRAHGACHDARVVNGPASAFCTAPGTAAPARAALAEADDVVVCVGTTLALQDAFSITPAAAQHLDGIQDTLAAPVGGVVLSPDHDADLQALGLDKTELQTVRARAAPRLRARLAHTTRLLCTLSRVCRFSSVLCSALQRMAALAAAGPGPAGSLATSLALTRVAPLPPGHFAAGERRPGGREPFGCFAGVAPIRKGAVLGIYWGAYMTDTEVECAQREAMQPRAGGGREGPPEIFEYLFELLSAGADGSSPLVVDAAPRGVRCWGGTINAAPRDGGGGGGANLLFLRATRGAGASAPLPDLKLPLLFCVAKADIAAGAEARVAARCACACAVCMQCCVSDASSHCTCVCSHAPAQLWADYGNGYWRAHERNIERAAKVKREEADAAAAAAAARRAPGAVALATGCPCRRLGSGITPALCDSCAPMQATVKQGHALRVRRRGGGSGSDAGGSDDGDAAEAAAPPKRKKTDKRAAGAAAGGAAGAAASLQPLTHTYVAVKSCGTQQRKQPQVARAPTPDNAYLFGDDSGDDDDDGGAAGAPPSPSPSSSSPPASPSPSPSPSPPASPSHAPAPAPAPPASPAAALRIAVMAACSAMPCDAALLALHASFQAASAPSAATAARAAAQAASACVNRLRAIMAPLQRFSDAETRLTQETLMQSAAGRDLAADIAAADAAAADAAAEVNAVDGETALLAAQRMPSAAAVPALSEAEERAVVDALAALCAACDAAAPASAALCAYRQAALPRVRAALQQLAAQRASDAAAAEADAEEVSRTHAQLAEELPVLVAAVQSANSYHELLDSARERIAAAHARAAAAAAAAREARAAADELAAAAGAE